MNYTDAKNLLEKYGQTQLLDYYDELTPSEQRMLLDDISRTDFGMLENLNGHVSSELGKLSPADALSVEDIQKRRREYEEEGLAAIRSGTGAGVDPVRPAVPRLVYRLAAEAQWRRLAREHGADLDARPADAG